jgi:alcohol dehydrogenase, propanol-preferring
MARARSGVCHTDLHAASGDWPVKPMPPFIPGHEAAGIVAALGPGVTNCKIGDAVGVAWLHDSCLACEYCATGWETLCEHQHNTGYSVNGGFAEYVIASAAFAARLPASVDFAAIAPILRRRHHLQGLARNRYAALRVGGDFPASAVSATSVFNTPRQWV